MRKTHIVRAAILLFPASFALAASCVGESETESDDPLLLDEVPAAEAPSALDGGCTTDSGTDGGGTGGGSSVTWPTCSPNDLWILCGVPRQADLSLSYGDLPAGECGKTNLNANSTTYCMPSVVMDPWEPGCAGDPCGAFRHEICHVAQLRAMCAGCKAAHPGGGAAFNGCVTNSSENCRWTMEAQCYNEGCDSGSEWQCFHQGVYCGLLDKFPPASGVGLECGQFTAGPSSCACSNMGSGQCSSGACSSGKSCVLSGSACACVSPPPPQDGGTDASSDAPEGG